MLLNSHGHRDTVDMESPIAGGICGMNDEYRTRRGSRGGRRNKNMNGRGACEASACDSNTTAAETQLKVKATIPESRQQSVFVEALVELVYDAPARAWTRVKKKKSSCKSGGVSAWILPDGKKCSAGTCDRNHDETHPGMPCYYDPRHEVFIPKGIFDNSRLLTRLVNERDVQARRLGVIAKPVKRARDPRSPLPTRTATSNNVQEPAAARQGGKGNENTEFNDTPGLGEIYRKMHVVCAVTLIQACWRGMIGRKDYQDAKQFKAEKDKLAMKKEQHAAAKRIQGHCRGVIGRNNYQVVKQRKDTIDRWTKYAKSVNERWAKMKTAAKQIQAVWRRSKYLALHGSTSEARS